MSVCILATGGDPGRRDREARDTALAAGSAAQIVDAGPDAPLPGDMRVAFASSAAPIERIASFFAHPMAQAARKIVVVAGGGAAAPAMFDIADMLIFSPAAFARTLELDAVPDDLAALLPVQALLVRHNQAAVVRLASGAAALWADRSMLVAGGEAGGDDSMVRFGATVAAAVDQGIGPEPALAMALAPGATRV